MRIESAPGLPPDHALRNDLMVGASEALLVARWEGADDAMRAAVPDLQPSRDLGNRHASVRQSADFDFALGDVRRSTYRLTGPGTVALRVTQAGCDALADTIGLELRDARQHVRHEPTAPGAEIDSVLQRDKGHARLVQVADAAHQVRR